MSDAAALRRALAERGFDCDVEARDRLAVLVPRAAFPALADREARDAIVALAAATGFTHIALELTEAPPDDATLPGRQLP